MNRAGPRTAACTPPEARARRHQAHAFVDVADLVLDEPPESAQPQVAAALAVLGAIAAADAICGLRLGRIARGQSHAEAVSLLELVDLPDRQLPSKLRRILKDKDRAHYSPRLMSTSDARVLVRQARLILDAADQL